MKKQKDSGFITGFHVTTVNALKEIEKNGFKVGGKCRFGSGVYFFINRKEAHSYNRTGVLVEALIPKKDIACLSYEELRGMFSDLDISWDEEEGVPELKDWALEKGYQGCLITYGDEVSELVVYEPSLISLGNEE